MFNNNNFLLVNNSQFNTILCNETIVHEISFNFFLAWNTFFSKFLTNFQKFEFCLISLNIMVFISCTFYVNL